MANFSTAASTAPANTTAAKSNGDRRLLRNGAPAHELTREDRAKGGRVRAERLRRRRELRERLKVAELEDLGEAEFDLLDQALIRLNLLIGSENDRVALRAVIEVLDRTLGRPRQQQGRDHSFERCADIDAALAEAREKLALRLERRGARAAVVMDALEHRRE
jgi:hypothetical protein